MLLWKDGAAAAKQARNTRTGSDEENWKNPFGKLNLSFGILKLQRKKKRKEIVGANKYPAAWIKVGNKNPLTPTERQLLYLSAPRRRLKRTQQVRKNEGRAKEGAENISSCRRRRRRRQTMTKD